MKKPHPLFVFLALVCAALTFVSGASAQSILLTVDISDPANVTFTATDNGALASDSTHSFFNGVELYTFFTDVPIDFNGTEGFSSSLTTSIDTAAVATYDSASVDGLSGSNVDLNLYGAGDGADNSPFENFVAGTQAFAGTFTLDLSGASTLPAAGFVGDIYTGDGTGSTGPPPTEEVGTDAITTQVLIGQYVVVPEANSAVLTLVAGAGLLVGLRLRRRRVA